MTHPTNDELRQFLDETLSESESLRFESHLQECVVCQETVESILSELTVSGPKKESEPPNRSPADSPMSNIEIGHRFILLGEIGRGGMGVVYRGFDRQLKREVAIKIAQRTDSDAAAIRFYREGQISGQLQHPGIVPVHQTGRLDDGRQFIAMRLVNGKSLLSIIDEAKGTSGSFQLFKVFNDVCNTIAYAHSKDVVHRDLKPENIMIGEFGEVQIMDWGLSKKLKPAKSSKGESPRTTKPIQARDSMQKEKIQCGRTLSAGPDQTQQGLVFGTPAYMAPEQALGESADKRTDVFALGGILYHILTGQAPFESATATDALANSDPQAIENAVRLLDETGSDSKLTSIVKDCMTHDASERPADAIVVKNIFSEYLAQREDKYENAMPSHMLAAPERMFWLCAVAILLITATVLYFW